MNDETDIPPGLPVARLDNSLVFDNGIRPAFNDIGHRLLHVDQTRNGTDRDAVIHGYYHRFTGLPVEYPFKSYAFACNHYFYFPSNRDIARLAGNIQVNKPLIPRIFLLEWRP